MQQCALFTFLFSSFFLFSEYIDEYGRRGEINGVTPSIVCAGRAVLSLLPPYMRRVYVCRPFRLQCAITCAGERVHQALLPCLSSRLPPFLLSPQPFPLAAISDSPLTGTVTLPHYLSIYNSACPLPSAAVPLNPIVPQYQSVNLPHY